MACGNSFPASTVLRRSVLALLALIAIGPVLAQPTPLGTAFTYQGRLTDGGAAAAGTYDFEIRLFDAASGGSQISGTLDRGDIAVVDGLFTVLLDFGANAFPGEARWLEIGVRPGNSGGAYTTLSGRQELTLVPNAIQASQLGGHDSAYHLSRSNHSGTQAPSSISPQGAASGLDSDRVDGYEAASLLSRSNHTGTQPPASLSPQGAGSGLDADTVDGMHAADFLAGSVNKVVRGVINFVGHNYEVQDQFSPSVDPARSVVILSPVIVGDGTGSSFNARIGAILVSL
ncbi:MAG TPA: hypothetical protein VF756_32150, partial [Thermoanaerobaculia bacterium]